MAGRNRFFRGGQSERVMRKADSRQERCVFISHKWEDAQFALLVAQELAALDIDYWLDVEDRETLTAAVAKDDKAMCEAIERGIQNSSHLLALISPRTKGSWWVPYEIGAARAYSRTLAFFVHRGVTERPAWVSLGQAVIADKDDFDKWATHISGQTSVQLRKSASFRGIDEVLPAYRYLR